MAVLAGRRALVTGCAGFIGSHLSERLVVDGASVRGVDAFTDYYERALKEANLAALREQPAFELVEADLAAGALEGLLDGVDVIFHQAAQAGVRGSWGTQFETYVRNNVTATQLLLEAAAVTGVPRVVVASSSSVYGDAATLPTSEDVVLRPLSPYGVTKAAAEHLALLYGRRYPSMQVAALRYFTVYGPRQRPDMAFTRFITALDRGERLIVFGDGRQARDFTFIDDAVEANVLAATRPEAEGSYNIGGGSVIELGEAIDTLARLTGRDARIDRRAAAAGDVRGTSADTSRAQADLGYAPRVGLEEGLRRQIAWVRDELHGARDGVASALR